MKKTKLVLSFILFIAAMLYVFGGGGNQQVGEYTQRHVFDNAEVISEVDASKFDRMLDLIEKESDLDIAFLFLKTIGNLSIEEVAVSKMDEYKVGFHGRKERGVLFLYVMDVRKFRIEVGYGLEAYFPDAFVDYLIRNQADAFFTDARPSVGLRLLIRVMQHRIREAVLNSDFDPRILNRETDFKRLSGGAGASRNVGVNEPGRGFNHEQYDKLERLQFVASETVNGTFNNYIEWLYGRKFDPNIDIFTIGSLPLLKRFPMTPAYFDYILMLYAGKQYKIAEKGDLAILYFTNDPLSSPLFFNRDAGKWRLNIEAEVRNSRNHVGGVFTWSFNPDSTDEFSRVFNSHLVNIRGYYRFRDGDNRQLPVKVDVQR